jgi:hypothetical protein
MEGLDKGGLGPISGCCAIEVEEEGLNLDHNTAYPDRGFSWFSCLPKKTPGYISNYTITISFHLHSYSFFTII